MLFSVMFLVSKEVGIDANYENAEVSNVMFTLFIERKVERA